MNEKQNSLRNYHYSMLFRTKNPKQGIVKTGGKPTKLLYTLNASYLKMKLFYQYRGSISEQRNLQNLENEFASFLHRTQRI